MSGTIIRITMQVTRAVDCPRTAGVQVRRDLAHSGQKDFS